MVALTRLNLAKAKVLLVDDNQQSLDLLLQMLSGFGVRTVRLCRSAAEARACMELEVFDLIVTDAEMPEEDGYTLSQSLRRRSDNANFTAPIILVSSHTPLNKISKARDAGVNFVVKKPVAPATLLSRITWLARNTREFVSSETYCGPDRRFKNTPLCEGQTERRADSIALIAVPERAMSQNEVDSLFG